MPIGNIKLADTCDICGAQNALLRTITHPCLGIIDHLSGYTCQKCLDSGKETAYVYKLADAEIAENKEYNDLVDEIEKLDPRTNSDPDAQDLVKITNRLDELDRLQELRDQRAERFQGIRLHNKAHFISERGLGVKHEKCEVCGQGNSYLCIVEDHFEGHVEILDEISGWFCADCITTGRQETHTSKAIRELTFFGKESPDIKNGKAKLMEKARLAYEGSPVKTVIKTADEGDSCFLCGKICGKEHLCGDN